MTYETLYVGFDTTAPRVDDLTVYDSLRTEFLGAPFAFDVIGSSHYVRSTRLSYHEVASCEPVEADAVTAVPVDAAGEHGTLTYETPALRVEMTVETHPLDDVPVPGDDRPARATTRDARGVTDGGRLLGDADLRYAFDADAVTAIDLGDARYETWHTYAEYGTALYTESRFERTR